jgi:hypothetical protein
MGVVPYVYRLLVCPTLRTDSCSYDNIVATHSGTVCATDPWWLHCLELQTRQSEKVKELPSNYNVL